MLDEPPSSNQDSKLEDQIVRLESYKEHLEKSLTNSTLIVLAIVVFYLIFGSLVGITFMISFDAPPNYWIIPIHFIIAITLTIITVRRVRANSKRKDNEVVERTNQEIEDLKNKIQSMKEIGNS